MLRLLMNTVLVIPSLLLGSSHESFTYSNTPAERAKHVMKILRRRDKPNTIQITINVTPQPTWMS